MPGVVLLEHVAQAMASCQPESVIVGFPTVKFQQVLRPGQLFEIQLQQKEAGRFNFECDVAGQVIASGTFMIRNVKAVL